MVQQILDWISTNLPTLGWIIAILSIFIEISPIKINPLSAIVRWLSKLFTGDTSKKIDSLIKKVDAI